MNDATPPTVALPPAITPPVAMPAAALAELTAPEFLRPSDPSRINDDQFITELNRLRELKGFLNNEAVYVGMTSTESATLGALFTLKAGGQFRGRSPTAAEWASVDYFNQHFFQVLTEAQRRRFLLGGIPRAFSRLPMVFAGIALASMLGSVAMPFVVKSAEGVTLGLFSSYLFWLISLGAMGSIAFIGMNALSVQQDITFDVLNSRLINLRISLGALFALVLTFPFGYDTYKSFMLSLLDQAVTGPTPQNASPGGLSAGAMLILPFLLGFSTSLVIMILNRLLDAAQSFFGKAAGTSTSSAVSGPGQPAARSPANPEGGQV